MDGAGNVVDGAKDMGGKMVDGVKDGAGAVVDGAKMSVAKSWTVQVMLWMVPRTWAVKW